MATQDENPYEVALYRSHRVEAVKVDQMSLDEIDTWLTTLGVDALIIDRSTSSVTVNGLMARKGEWIVAFDENNVRVVNEIDFRRDYVRES